jgi:hypothetical protein
MKFFLENCRYGKRRHLDSLAASTFYLKSLLNAKLVPETTKHSEYNFLLIFHITVVYKLFVNEFISVSIACLLGD